MIDSGAGEPDERPAVTLVVEARDLDTDARSRSTVLVPAPRDAGEQRSQLVAATTGLHPESRLRSFANAAATFVDRQHLIVASYLDLPSARAIAPASASAPQERLFA